MFVKTQYKDSQYDLQQRGTKFNIKLTNNFYNNAANLDIFETWTNKVNSIAKI